MGSGCPSSLLSRAGKGEKEESGSVNCWQRKVIRIYLTKPLSLQENKIQNNWRLYKRGWKNTCFLCLAAFLCRDFLCLYLCPFLLCGAGAARQENLTRSVWTGWCHHCRDVAALRKTFLSVAHLWRHISSHCCGLLISHSLASKIKRKLLTSLKFHAWDNPVLSLVARNATTGFLRILEGNFAFFV